MAMEIKLPDLGDGIESGDVLDILVSEGDQIEKDQGIVELETDKATVEVPCTVAGTVTKVLVTTGQTVKVGEPLITVEASAGATRSAAPAPAAPKSSAAPQPPREPVAGQSAASRSPTAPTSEPAPATASVPRPTPATASPASQPAAPAPAARKSPAPRRMAPTTVAAGPAIRRFAREVGVDLATVAGSGPGGRVTREDVLEVVRSANLAAKSKDASLDDVMNVPGTPGQDAWGPVSVEAAPRIRKAIAKQMTESWLTVARVTNFDDADVTELERMRQSSKADYAASGIKLTSMPFLIKAVSMALRRNPVLNASIDVEKGEITYKRYINIGVAVDTDRGLVVPALRNTDQRSIAETARDLAKMTQRVRNSDFDLEDLRGGTFTISNLGAIGGTYSTPIVNVPEVAILLVGRSRKLPVVVDDQVQIRLMMPMSLSYDHRLVDGAMAARFLNDVIGYLQAPGRLLLAP